MRTSEPVTVIERTTSALSVAPNLVDYEATRRSFDWGVARSVLDGLPGGGCEHAYEAVDRHANGGRAGNTAFIYMHADGSRRATTYADLARNANRFANVLSDLGVRRETGCSS